MCQGPACSRCRSLLRCACHSPRLHHPCSVDDCTGPLKGTVDCKFVDDPGFMACKAQVKQSLVAATCISSAISCFLMAFLANMPLAVAPGMGINAYFTYQVGGGVCCVCQGGGGMEGGCLPHC